MSGEFEVLRYRPEFEKETARLHAVLVPGRDPAFSARYLAWKYRENPYIAAPLIYLARHEGRIVGMRGFFGSLWETAAGAAIVPCAADLVVDPAYRGKGLARLIVEAAAKDFAALGHGYIFSLSAGRVTALGQLAQGFKLIAPMAPYLFDRRGMFDRLTVPPHFAQFDAGDAAAEGFTAASAPRAEAMAAFLAALPAGGRLRQRRDAAYFAWRFRNPLSVYRFLYAGEDALDGYIVLVAKLNDPAGPIWIVDWEARESGLRARLLHEAVKLGRRRQIAAWRFGTDEAGLGFLASAGFAPEAEADGLKSLKLGVMVRPLGGQDGRLGDILTPAGWDFRALYSDFS